MDVNNGILDGDLIGQTAGVARRLCVRALRLVSRTAMEVTENFAIDHPFFAGWNVAAGVVVAGIRHECRRMNYRRLIWAAKTDSNP